MVVIVSTSIKALSRLGRKEPEMELLVVLGAFVLVDVLALRYGTDSRQNVTNPDAHAAVRSGN